MDLKGEWSRLMPVAKTVLGLASGQPQLLGPVDLTILFTDLEGYSHLTEAIGDRNAYRLVRTHNRLVRRALGQSGGVEVKQTGDGIMAYFLSASRAVKCAVEVQRAVDAHNRQSAGPALNVAIGINTGAPILDGGDIFGAAVNIAARLAARAEGRHIVVSDVVRLLTAGKGFSFRPIGKEHLDGLTEAVKLYEVSWQPAPAPLPRSN